MKYYKDPNTNEVYAYEVDGSQDAFIKEGLISITNIEADAIRTSLIPPFTYAQKRAVAYPSFADQFDLLYHGGYDAWKAAIDAVKQEYPKP